ncbi:MaoC family dehydratase N-terminal domain-containing protein [Bacillus songklensis]|uniref:MaoC family dehydratase N-terminal domain-containing protein n=1 Tax=Bacillus songklensis TaxID=1069116 RepID=A0ABV8B6X5_9BACI
MKSRVDETAVVFQPFTFTVERGKIKELAMAIGDQNRVYYHVEEAKKEGYRDIPVPPTFGTVMDFWGGLDFDTLVQTLQLNPLKVLHGEQEYQYEDIVCAGDVITAQARVVKQLEKKGMKMIKLETEYKRDGDTVMVARSTIIERP